MATAAQLAAVKTAAREMTVEVGIAIRTLEVVSQAKLTARLANTIVTEPILNLMVEKLIESDLVKRHELDGDLLVWVGR